MTEEEQEQTVKNDEELEQTASAQDKEHAVKTDDKLNQTAMTGGGGT